MNPIHKVPQPSICMADLIHHASKGDLVESSRAHIGATSACLGQFLVTQGVPVVHLLGDFAHNDMSYKPHLSISEHGTIEIGDKGISTHMMCAHTADVNHHLEAGMSVSNFHLAKLKHVFPSCQTKRLSQLIQKNQDLVFKIVEQSWDITCGNPRHCFKHYIEEDGSVSTRPAPDSFESIADDIALVTRKTGWKIPTYVIIVLNIILGSTKCREYYHICGGAMWEYIDKFDYQILIDSILDKMQCSGRRMCLVSASSFRVFTRTGDSDLLDEIWYAWKKLGQENQGKIRTKIESVVTEKIRSKKLPWYDRCDHTHETTQHDLGTADDIHVPSWAIHANFEELSRFVAYTEKIWRSRNR